MEINLPQMYQHFKGDYYVLVQIAKHHANDTEWAVYRRVGDESTYYVRPFSQFSDLKIEEGDGEDFKVPRFRLVDESEAVALTIDKLREEANARHAAATTLEERVSARLVEMLADKLEAELGAKG